MNEKCQTLKPLGRLCMTIGELPVSYVESMSYYEQLLWLTKFLQEQVIPVVNHNSNIVNELQDYVEHYFDNLDVQEEINNKLDEMAESGQLTDIIAQYLGLAGMITYNTVSEMKSATNIVNGSKCQTLGFYSVNDGGGATYKVRTITNDDVVDEATIIALYDDSLIAELIINDNINLLQVGCHGDGVTDDTTLLNKAITIATNKGLGLYSPKRTYLLSDNITIGSIDLYLSECTFKNDNTLTITATEKVLNLPKYISVSALSNNVGINIFESINCMIFVPFISGFAVGLRYSGDTKGCCYHTTNIQEIYNCINSFSILATNTGWVNENIFIGGRLWNSSEFITTYGSSIVKLDLKGTSTHKVNNNYFLKQCIEGQDGSSGGIKIKLDYCDYITFDNLRYEGADPKVDMTNSGRIYLNNGFNLTSVTYPHDKPNISIGGQFNEINADVSVGTVYSNVKMNSNAYASYQTLRTDGTIANKITGQGIFTHNTSGNDTWKFDNNGLNYNNAGSYKRMWSGSGKWSFIPQSDGTNGGLVLNTGTSISGGCFLWYNDGHLYGKIGQPSNATDGTILL